MEVKPGYKLTEVGVIPEDWSVAPLESVTPLNVKNGIVDGPFGSNLKTIHYRTSGIPIITSGYVTNGKFQADKYLYVDRAKFVEEKRSSVQPGDIVMAKIGERCGASAILPESHETGILSGNALKITVDRLRHSTFYVWQVLWNLHTSGKLELLRTVGAQPAISMANLKKHKIPLPPTKAEQEAIAGALSDADALIESLEQLLAKKRHLKQGAMQELITGKKRLPGFATGHRYKETEVGMIPEDWQVKVLPEVCRFRGGKSHEQHISDFGRFVCVNSKFISTNGSVRKYSTANLCCAKRNDVLMVMSDLPNGRALAKAFFVDQDELYAVNQRVCALTAYRDCPKFLFYILNRNPYFLKFDDGVNQTHLLNRVFQKCPILLPATNDEQSAIATVLSDIDAEIAALEAKLTKTRQVKQGMMQELLTGRIRLV